MDFIRRKPAIDIDDDYIWNRKGIIQAGLVGIISLAATLFGLSFLSIEVTHLTAMNFQRFGALLMGLLWTLVFGAQTAMCFNGVATIISNNARRNRWLKQASRSQVKIADRKEEYNEYAETREEMWVCSLAILWPPSTEGEQHGQVAWLRVSRRVYDRYRAQDVAHILSDPSDSNVFIFEGE